LTGLAARVTRVTYTQVARLAFVPLVVGVGVLAFLLHGRAPAPAPAPAPPAKVVPKSPISHDTAKTRAAFDEIYRDATWGSNSEGVGTSGRGSTAHATLLYRTFLQQFLADKKITSVVDAGCGDWEFSQTIDWTGIDYKGYDIVDSVVRKNTERFAKPNIQFFQADIVETELPAADLLISKHVLQHLPTSAVEKFLRQLRKYRHVLLVNGVDRHTLSADNTDIPPGGYRPLDLTQPPFNVEGIKVLTYQDATKTMHQVIYIFNPQPER